MAGCTIGALMSESFCERVLSVANNVVDEGNTLLRDEEVSMLTILRINRSFMEYMRATYKEESRQDFNLTIVPKEAYQPPPLVTM